MLSVRVGVLALAALWPSTAPPPAKPLGPAAALSALGGGSPESLAAGLRAYLVTAFPDPLLEDSKHWGGQRRYTKGLRKGQSLNDGRWWKVRVTGRNLRDTLIVDLRDLQKPESGRTTFTLFLSFDAGVQLDRQTWHSGVRLYSGSTRARLRVKLTLKCEATSRVEGSGLLAETVFRLRVLESKLAYDNVVVEHTAGVGGEAAKLLGDAALSVLRQVKPSLERDLLAKANAAVVKAGDTKEVRVGLKSLFGKK